jgi:translocation and assembly module TamB
MDVQVDMGPQVALTAKGLQATLSGTVHVKQAPQSTMTATGELNVVEGTYKAYGQNLSIDQGALFFTGGAIDNPGINLRASKSIGSSSNNQLLDLNDTNSQNARLRGNVTVGVEVTGRLIDPDIQLFSNPAILSQSDILSMLVLGRPASQANKAGGQLLLAAISSMDLGNGTKGLQLLEQLKNNLGIDFNVESNSNYNLLTNTVSDKTAFVVSKSLSKRISIGYNVGLSQADPNVVTLKYVLNKFFSIQVNTSSTNSGVDVLYTSSKK